jgi:hypothetical protein
MSHMWEIYLQEGNKNKHKKTGGKAPIFLQQGVALKLGENNESKPWN